MMTEPTDLDQLCFKAFQAMAIKDCEAMTTKAMLAYPDQFEGHSFDSAYEMIQARGDILDSQDRAAYTHACINQESYASPFRASRWYRGEPA